MVSFSQLKKHGAQQPDAGQSMTNTVTVASPNAVQLRLFCRSELAREELTGAAFTQETRVIVDVFREQELGVPLAPTEGDVRLTERHYG